MSILNYLTEQLNRKKYTSDEKDKSLELTDTTPKINSDFVIDSHNIKKELLGDHIPFDDDEFSHFKTKSQIPPDELTRSQVVWDWNDEHLEDYIVTIKKREYGDKYVYEVVQTGDAELTNNNSKYQGTDRDVYSIPFTEYNFKFVYEFLSALGIFE